MKKKNFIKKAVYPGGKKALINFIKHNLKYPKEAIKNKIEGSVLVKFKVNHAGQTFDAHIISGIGHGCDKEAIRIVKKLKYPGGLNRNIRVTTNKKMTIKFKLPQKNNTLKIQYHITQ
tara:strand:- start:298 stop:651 length:354 start_codon:yes stop_codon:yes gene_type:complete